MSAARLPVAPRERTLELGAGDRRLTSRVWEKGPEDAPPLGFLAGFLGLPRWTPFLDRLAETRRVVAPALPGFPGGRGHEHLDSLLDWVVATQELLEAAGLVGADWVGASVGGALAVEAAALDPSATSVRRLVLLAPFGLFDAREPVTDVWAQTPGSLPALLASDPEAVAAQRARPEGLTPAQAADWELEGVRASEAAARLLWPLCDLGAEKRLHRIRVPTLVLWGGEDRVVPASTAKRYAEGIRGPCTVRSIEGAGHLLELDAPDAAAEAVQAFLA